MCQRKYIIGIVFGLLISLAAKSQIPRAGLVVLYQFNGNTIDSSSNSLDGFNIGSTFTNDRFGNSNGAIKFDGINDFVSFPSDPLLRPNFPFTVSFWSKIKYTTQSNNVAFCLEDASTQYQGAWLTFGSTNNFEIKANYGDGGGRSPGNRISRIAATLKDTSKWDLFTIIYQAHNQLIVMMNCDTLLTSSTGSGGNIAYSGIPGWIGRGAGACSGGYCYFDGIIDDFAIWNRTLSSSEIENICTNCLSDTVAIIKSNDTLIASVSDAHYQWYDCSTNQPVYSDTNQFYIPIISGDYKVVTEKNGCIDTSLCQTILITGIGENNLLNNISVFPSPTSNKLFLMNEGSNIKQFEILDLNGQILLSNLRVEEHIDVSRLSSGIYFIKVYTEKGVVTRKFVKN